MRALSLISAWLLITACLSSCGPTYSAFTQDLYEDYRWDEDELRGIQFYLSEDVILRREYTGGTSEIAAGEITLIEGRETEQVVIPRGTPGVFLFRPKSNRFAISFEEGGNDKYLIFGPNPKMGDRYVLLASRWYRRDGTVTYAGKKYHVDARSAYATLMVDLKRVQKSSQNSRTVRGRQVEAY